MRQNNLNKINTWLKIADAAEVAEVTRTNIVRNEQNPSWEKVEMSLRALCDGDYERPIQFDVYDYRKMTQPVIIGSFTTTYAQLKNGAEFKCINPKKSAKKHRFTEYTDSGTVYLKFLKVKTG